MAKRAVTKKWATIHGLPELTRKINDVIQAVEGEDILRVIMAGTKHIERAAKAKVPVDTGNLKGAIYAAYGKQKNKKKPSVIAGVNYSNQNSSLKYAPYAHIVEFGSSSRQAQPFFGPAITAERNNVAKTFADGFKAILEKTVKK